MRHQPTLVASALLGAALLTACGDGLTGAPCDTTGTGNIAVSITGLPAGMDANVWAIGPADTVQLTETSTLTGVSGGRYHFTSIPVEVVDSTVSRMLVGTVPTNFFCLRDGAAINVAIPHTQVGSSGKVWVGAGYNSLGFTTAQLATTATLAPQVTSATRGSAGAAFDNFGNLWVRGFTASEPFLMRYSAASLASNGAPVPDRAINLSGVSCEGTTGMAFRSDGSLWISIGCEQRVVQLAAAQLATSGTVTPTTQITGLVAPEGLAFDLAGNLWVADATHLRRYNSARLSLSITTAADLRATFKTPSPPAPADTSLNVHNIAFSPSGELWLSTYGQNALYRVEAAVVAATGAQHTLVSRIIYFSSFAQPRGFAFDNTGGVFIAYLASSFARLSPAQLGSSVLLPSTVTPGKVYASSSIVAFAENVALYPAPAATPLYSRAQ